jgi:hypothetical protein
MEEAAREDGLFFTRLMKAKLMAVASMVLDGVWHFTPTSVGFSF